MAPQESRKPGRPRSAESDRAIIQATLRLLSERGYAGMSIERVAAEAGVGKTTIYRRYPTKEELAASAMSSLVQEASSPPETGSARTDLIEMMAQIFTIFTRGPAFAMIGALLVEERRNPELLELFRQRIIFPRREQAMAVLRRGVQRGELRPDADLEVAVEAIVGSLFARHIMGRPESAEHFERTVDVVWKGLAIDS